MGIELRLICNRCNHSTPHRYDGDQNFLGHYAFELYTCLVCGDTRSLNQSVEWIVFTDTLKQIKSIEQTARETDEYEPATLQKVEYLVESCRGQMPEEWVEHIDRVAQEYREAYQTWLMKDGKQ